MRCQSHQHSKFKQLLTYSFYMLIAFVGFRFTVSQPAQAACLLSYDNAETLTQGDGLARLSFQGGQEGLGGHLEGRLGLPGERELYLRSGGCERSSLWSWAIESGINQQFLSAEETGLVDIALRLSIVALLGDQDQSEHSEIGLQPSFLVSYPFRVSEERKGFITLSLGLSTYFTDQKHYKVKQEDQDQIEEIELESALLWDPIISLASAVDILPKLPLALEIRWQQGGVYGGASVAYFF